ncbi:MAG: tRNA (adenosine(37)-N6)-threonylcarbamoyltransferase complex dimerization subunit type 1 TsaB [Ignavibacterium sp.]|nr:MAG: tRNA (adenosine(37)-N6)-threonylcarbamoyltransferase complex dimerization subunit type 1 TsaB [Ignavibacterium sp.]
MNELKPILAVETSDILCSAALYFSDDKFFSSNIYMEHSHSQNLFEIIEFLFNTAEIKSEQIGSVAVSGGPGSFTGLRIGMSAAKGIASGASVPMVIVPTLEALAYQLSSVISEETVIIANKVNKDEVYYSKFKIKSNSYIFVEELTILPNEEFIERVGGTKVIGNANAILNKNSQQHMISSPSAEFIARWALKYGKDLFSNEYDYFEPMYVKNFQVTKRNKK